MANALVKLIFCNNAGVFQCVFYVCCRCAGAVAVKSERDSIIYYDGLVDDRIDEDNLMTLMMV